MCVAIAEPLFISVSKARKKVQWQDVDQLCGQLQLNVPEKKTIMVDGKNESRLFAQYLPDATVTLYPATETEKQCCAPVPGGVPRPVLPS